MPDVLHKNLPILEVSEKIILDELMLDRQAASMILLQMSDTVAVIEPGKYDTLLTRLRKLDHTPKADP